MCIETLQVEMLTRLKNWNYHLIWKVCHMAVDCARGYQAMWSKYLMAFRSQHHKFSVLRHCLENSRFLLFYSPNLWYFIEVVSNYPSRKNKGKAYALIGINSARIPYGMVWECVIPHANAEELWTAQYIAALKIVAGTFNVVGIRSKKESIALGNITILALINHSLTK